MTGPGDTTEVPDVSWAAAKLLQRAEACVSLSPAWLGPLAALDPDALLPAERVTLTLVLQRMTAVVEAAALRALASVPNLSCVPDPALRAAHPDAAARMCAGGSACFHYWELEELSALTGLPRWLVSKRRALAWQLADAWPALLPLLAGGRVTLEHLQRFQLATLNANDEAMAAAVAAFLGLVESGSHLSVDSLSRAVRRVVARHTEPAEAKVKARDDIREQTGVHFETLSDGLASLTLVGETCKLEALRALVHEHPAVTRLDPGDERTRGQCQVDLLVGLCLMGSGYGANTGLVRPGSSDSATGWAGTSEAAEPAVGVTITVSMETLLGLSNEPGTVGDTVQSAAVIRQWAGDPIWARRAVLDHHGKIASIGSKQRFPAGGLRRAVQQRWQRCTFPGCNRPATESQIDHATPYALGGTTSLGELHPLCHKHHRMKDLPGVYVRLCADGTAVWTMPSGRILRVPAADHSIKPGPHDGKPDDDGRADPPDMTVEEAMPDQLWEAWIADVIARDPELQPTMA